MRSRLRITRDGDAFLARLAPSQAEAAHRALTVLLNSGTGPATLAVRLGASPEAVGTLVERLGGERECSIELRLTVGELHTLHSALTAAATLFLSDGRSSEEEFHRQTTFYRENFDALALGITEAAAEAQASPERQREST
ncbi:MULTISPECIES: hypothetical protein [Streptomyces]|uniref:MarR family transcriptional regulator n=2 Tax=Streptomyces TaxID=1883 RepID=A0ABV9J1Z0_9ACTN